MHQFLCYLKFYKDGIRLIIEVLGVVIAILSLNNGVKQIRVTRETNNCPMLSFINVKERKATNSCINYSLRKDQLKTIDKYYTITVKNIGKGLMRDIQIYSLSLCDDRNEPLLLKTYPSIFNKVISDLEIDINCKGVFNIEFSKDEFIELNKRNLLFLIVYKNIYKDLYTSILQIHFDDKINEIEKVLFFNEGSNGFNALFNHYSSNCILDYIKKKSKNNINWEITLK